MQQTQEDYETRAGRLADGTSQNPDEDRRLVEQYEANGYSRDGKADAADAVAQPTVRETPQDDKGGRRSSIK